VTCAYSVFPSESFSSFAVILEMLHYQELWFRNLASSKTCSTCKFSSFAVLCNPIPILHVAEDFIIFLGENISGMIAHIRNILFRILIT
jgi:hypothetical protein